MERTNGKPSNRQAIDEFLASKGQPALQGVMATKRNVFGRRKPYIKRRELWLWQQECARPQWVGTKIWR